MTSCENICLSSSAKREAVQYKCSVGETPKLDGDFHVNKTIQRRRFRPYVQTTNYIENMSAVGRKP